MPWEAILGGATGGVAFAVVIAVFFFKSVTEKLIEGAEKRFESALRRSESLHQSLLSTATTIDTDLRTHRIEVYAELWKRTGSLPKWPRNLDLDYQELQHLTSDLRKWYFERGGMYLSTTARKAYGDVQEAFASVLKEKKGGTVSEDDYDVIRDQCSALRNELTRDLLSRREAPDISAAAV
jgi:hypothetical protein